MQELRVFIQQAIDKQGLSLLAIEKRSGGKIKDSYIKDILKGKTKTISVDKLNALAEGLGVDGLELYKAASGNPVTLKHEDPWPGHILLQVFTRILDDPDMTAIVKALVRLKSSRLKTLRKQLETS